MVPSRNALDLIKKFEGCKLESYKDSGGVWTVGWGTTGPGIVEGLTVTQGVADAMLLGHIREIALDITPLVKLIPNQNQFDAIICLTYNIGVGAFKASTLLKCLLTRQFDKVAEEFLKWNHVHGKVVAGLTARRQAERSLFLQSL